MRLSLLLLCALFLLGAASLGPTVTSSVRIHNYGFAPAVDTVSLHDTVKWINEDSATHTSCSKSGSADQWTSGDIPPGDSYSRPFNQVGTFHYQCTASGAQGTIVVISQSPVRATTWGRLKTLFLSKAGVPR